MEISDLSPAEAAALQRMLNYWINTWDWECPTLFGLEKEDLSMILADWPASLAHHEEVAALAIQGAFRESLYGASTIPPAKIESVFGLSQASLQALWDRLRHRITRALG